MAEEKIYTIPLRKEWLKVPIYKRTRKSITATKQFLLRHLKQEVRIGPYLNEYIWKQGNRHPPARVKVRVEEEDKKLTAELINAPRKEKKEEKDTIKIKKPEFLKKKDDVEKEQVVEEKKEIAKKAIEKVPEDKLKEKEEKETAKISDVKKKSPKKENIIPIERKGK